MAVGRVIVWVFLYFTQNNRSGFCQDTTKFLNNMAKEYTLNKFSNLVDSSANSNSDSSDSEDLKLPKTKAEKVSVDTNLAPKSSWASSFKNSMLGVASSISSNVKKAVQQGSALAVNSDFYKKMKYKFSSNELSDKCTPYNMERMGEGIIAYLRRVDYLDGPQREEVCKLFDEIPEFNDIKINYYTLKTYKYPHMVYVELGNIINTLESHVESKNKKYEKQTVENNNNNNNITTGPMGELAPYIANVDDLIILPLVERVIFLWYQSLTYFLNIFLDVHRHEETKIFVTKMLKRLKWSFLATWNVSDNEKMDYHRYLLCDILNKYVIVDNIIRKAINKLPPPCTKFNPQEYYYFNKLIPTGTASIYPQLDRQTLKETKFTSSDVGASKKIYENKDKPVNKDKLENKDKQENKDKHVNKD